MRRFGIPRSSGDPRYVFRSDAELKAHSNYRSAKAGDIASALQLVVDLAPPLIERTQVFGRDVVYVAPHAQEATGDNAIPQVLAVYLAALHDAEDDSVIVQRNKVFHTGASAMQRLIAPSEFVGEVRRDRRYVLVDDVTTLGGTLADLSSYIQSNGGWIAGR
jgi:hypothetical protein